MHPACNRVQPRCIPTYPPQARTAVTAARASLTLSRRAYNKAMDYLEQISLDIQRKQAAAEGGEAEEGEGGGGGEGGGEGGEGGVSGVGQAKRDDDRAGGGEAKDGGGGGAADDGAPGPAAVGGVDTDGELTVF